MANPPVQYKSRALQAQGQYAHNLGPAAGRFGEQFVVSLGITSADNP